MVSTGILDDSGSLYLVSSECRISHGQQWPTMLPSKRADVT